MASLKLLVLSGKLTSEEGQALEAAYRRCRTDKDFEEVGRAVELASRGWREQGDFCSHLMRAADDEDGWGDEPDPPALAEALERARVKL